MTHPHKECVLVTHWYSLISQASSFPGATLPWVAASPPWARTPSLLTPSLAPFVKSGLSHTNSSPLLLGWLYLAPEPMGSCQGPG